MPNNDKDKDKDERLSRDRDRNASDAKSGTNDREASRRTERKDASKDDFSDIGTDAQQADGSAAGPSTS